MQCLFGLLWAVVGFLPDKSNLARDSWRLRTSSIDSVFLNNRLCISPKFGAGFTCDLAINEKKNENEHKPLIIWMWKWCYDNLRSCGGSRDFSSGATKLNRNWRLTFSSVPNSNIFGDSILIFGTFIGFAFGWATKPPAASAIFDFFADDSLFGVFKFFWPFGFRKGVPIERISMNNFCQSIK